MIHPDLYWRLPKRPNLEDELLAAGRRLQERTGQQARTLYVAPGELLEAEGLRVVESRRLQPGYWLLSAGE